MVVAQAGTQETGGQELTGMVVAPEAGTDMMLPQIPEAEAEAVAPEAAMETRAEAVAELAYLELGPLAPAV